MDTQKKLLKSLTADIPLRVLDAFKVCLTAHRNQTRKKGDIPYAVHPLRVYTFVHDIISVAQGDSTMDEAALCGALLHDVVEDTSVTLKEIEEQFGARIAKVVDELTIPGGLNHKEKTATLIKHAKAMGNRARIIKSVDRLDNMSDMLDCFSDRGKFHYTIEAIKLHKALLEGVVVDELRSSALLALEELMRMIKAVIAEGKQRDYRDFYFIKM